MRVLHVIETLEFGGAEKVLIDLANASLAACEVAICCIKRGGGLLNKVDPRIRVTCLDKGEGNDWSVPSRLAATVRDGGFDVIHAHQWGTYLECTAAALMTGRPRLVHTVHGLYTHYAPGGWSGAKIALRHWLERRGAARHERIVTVSDSIRDYVVRDVGIAADKVTTIYNGIPDTPLRAVERNGHTFLSVGRLADVKNHAMMLRAFALLRERRPQAQLQIAGDGPERGRLEDLARELGLGDSVRFLGFRNNVADLLAGADVFLMSSRYEGISIALLEAMSCRLAVVATRVGGVPETVQHDHSGLLVPDDDHAAMAEAMQQLMDSEPLRQRLGAAGQELQRERFSIAGTARQYQQLYASEL
jgi:glycosyltransferase involved in cell wall biosynthesis